jgi:hypothetical protein
MPFGALQDPLKCKWNDVLAASVGRFQGPDPYLIFRRSGSFPSDEQ